MMLSSEKKTGNFICLICKKTKNKKKNKQCEDCFIKLLNYNNNREVNLPEWINKDNVFVKRSGIKEIIESNWKVIGEIHVNNNMYIKLLSCDKQYIKNVKYDEFIDIQIREKL